MSLSAAGDSPDYVIGRGNLAGKAVYANRDFQPGEVVLQYKWRELTTEQWADLSESDKQFAHSFWGRIQLFGVPERYVNHSDQPNTKQDLQALADRAIRPIKAGEEITTDTRLELKNELESLLEMVIIRPGSAKPTIRWTATAYDSASCLYCPVNGSPVVISLNRLEGRWRIASQEAAP